MAACDEGYRCDVCDGDVTSIVDSDLYLRFIIGQLDPERLHVTPERHLRCNPVLAQYIDDRRFDPPVEVKGDFDRRRLDGNHAAQQARLVTAGYRRMHEIAAAGQPIDLRDYPLVEVADRYRGS